MKALFTFRGFFVREIFLHEIISPNNLIYNTTNYYQLSQSFFYHKQFPIITNLFFIIVNNFPLSQSFFIIINNSPLSQSFFIIINNFPLSQIISHYHKSLPLQFF